MKRMIVAAAAAACMLSFPAMAEWSYCSELPQIRQAAEAGSAEAQGDLGTYI